MKGKDKALVVLSNMLEIPPSNLKTLGKKHKEDENEPKKVFSVREHFLSCFCQRSCSTQPESAPRFGVFYVQEHQPLEWAVSSGWVGSASCFVAKLRKFESSHNTELFSPNTHIKHGNWYTDGERDTEMNTQREIYPLGLAEDSLTSSCLEEAKF